ncbi:MAG: hypothetical protein ABIJ00_10915 [Candidatus Eisenbacteria bacterium]
MRLNSAVGLILMLVVFAQAGAIGADPERSIELKTTAQIEMEVINKEGKKEIQRVEATKVVPGDEVLYTIHYANVGDDVAERVVITDAIPDHMIYTDGSASGGGTTVTFSVDSGRTYDVATNLKVAEADGKQRQANASDYTHICWTFEDTLLPSTAGYVAFRAKLQ